MGQIVCQKVDFECLGVLGDWVDLYFIMNFCNEVDEVCVFGKILEKGYVFCGLKLVNWCFDCGLVLVEVEVEYVDCIDLLIDVGFLFVDIDVLVSVFYVGVDVFKVKLGWIVIWIIMLWMIFFNQVLNLYLEIEYVLVDMLCGLLIVVKECVEVCL